MPPVPEQPERMDVLCERCNTRYEFDESLVSARGTTVKCTQCGLLFKVFPPQGRSSVQSWTVQRLNGERYVFHKMRELQAAITRGKVDPDDVLIPSVGRPKRLGDIEELTSFFPSSDPDLATPRRAQRSGGTRIGLAPPPEAKVTRVEPSVRRDRDRDGVPLPARTGMTLPPPGVDSAPSLGLAELEAEAGGGGELPPHDPEAPTLQVGLREIVTPPPAPSSSIGEAVAAVQHAMANVLGPDSQSQPARAAADRPSASSRETRVRDDAEAPTRQASLEKETRVRDEPEEPTLPMPPEADPAADESARAREREQSERETRVRDEPEEPTIRMPPERDTRIRDDAREPLPVMPRAVREAVHPPRRRRPDTTPELQVRPRGRTINDEDSDFGSPDSARPTLRRAEDAPRFEESELDITQDDRDVAPLPGHDGHLPLTISEGPPSTPPSHPDSDGGASMPPLTPSPSMARPSILARSGAHSGPRFSSYAGGTRRRPSFARWAVGLVVVGVLGVGGYTAVKRYLPAPNGSPSAHPQDARVDRFLQSGRDRLVAGDLEGAREQFVMASGVDDHDPRVLEALADVQIILADQAWLELRLLPEDSPRRAEITQKLERSTKRAEETAERLETAAPRSRGSVRARLALLRLRGDLDGARSLVDQLPNPGPEDAMVLAALDLGAPEPSWKTVLDRLQTAARAEQRLGRAAAYFVYAAALAHRREQAREQLDLLGSYSPPHPLVEPLREWLAALPEEPDSPDGGSDEDGDSAAAEGDEDGIPSDFREALKKARQAMSDGKLDRAAALYRAALDKNPGNNEALAGLAEVARAKGDEAGAIRAYETLLAQNPGYVPAIAALADLKWQTGAKGEARSLYRQVIDAAPGSSYAKHARSRLDSSEGGSGSSGSSHATGEPASTPSKPTAAPPAATTEPPPPSTGLPQDLPPGVDISDLPDLH